LKNNARERDSPTKIQTKTLRLEKIVQQKVQRKTWREIYRTKNGNIEGNIQYCSVSKVFQLSKLSAQSYIRLMSRKINKSPMQAVSQSSLC